MTQPELPGYENPALRYAWLRPNQLSPKRGGGRHDLYWTGHRTWTTPDVQAPRTFDTAQDADDALAAEYGPRTTWPGYLHSVLRDLQLTRIHADPEPLPARQPAPTPALTPHSRQGPPMLSDDHLPALQITIRATTSSDLPAVLHALNTHHLTSDFTADDTHPLTDLQPGHTYVTRAGADTAEHLATALASTAPNTAFELSNDPAETQHGTHIAYHPEAGLFRAQCNADGTPLVPAAEIAHALAQAPADMPLRTWLALHAPALLGTRVHAALARTSDHPQHAFRHTDTRPSHGQAARCGACGTPITWYYDDPDADTPYGHWFDSEDRDLCPATDVDADDPGHTPAPTPADFHQAALYLPPDPAARNESFPVTAFAGLRIGTYIDDDYTVHIGVLTETAHPALRTTPNGHLAVELRIDSHPLHTPAHHPADADDPEWTVTGVRWNETPEDVVALTALPGTHEPASHDVSDELSGWVRHLRAPNADTALRLARASAASPEAVAAFRADDNA